MPADETQPGNAELLPISGSLSAFTSMRIDLNSSRKAGAAMTIAREVPCDLLIHSLSALLLPCCSASGPWLARHRTRSDASARI
ncbi:protein of unknown function [Magnetospirillum sp. XM-1]|nr:protein of unknown function [Magnetospirillum sp. XM-1]